ncbi:MAG: hypothetical protein GFGODING_01460 [Flavobacteriales bacterium]|nr:hypothetical protein [Flavobacteriales bacterium]
MEPKTRTLIQAALIVLLITAVVALRRPAAPATPPVDSTAMAR